MRVEVREGESIEGLEIRLSEGISVSGFAVDQRSGQPVAGARVYLLARNVSNESAQAQSGVMRRNRGEQTAEGGEAASPESLAERRRGGRSGRAEARGAAASAILSAVDGKADTKVEQPAS